MISKSHTEVSKLVLEQLVPKDADHQVHDDIGGEVVKLEMK